MSKRNAPEVNAGSMADIAFLLLIFFLVTTTLASDIGINRRLPPKIDGPVDPPPIRKMDLFEVSINRNNNLLVEQEPMDISQLREATIAFLDNNGKGNCNYCKGKQVINLSSHPSKAVIAVSNSRETSYSTFIAVQNELIAAYNHLRDRESVRLYGESFRSITSKWKAAEDGSTEKEALKNKRDYIKSLFPERISESESES